MQPSHALFNLAHFCLSNHAETNPDKPALITLNKAGTEIIWSYQRLFDEVLQLASGLKTLPLKPGSRITLYSHKNAELLIFYFAAIAASFVPIALQPHLNKQQVEYILNDSQSSLFFQDPSITTTVELPDFCENLSLDKLNELSTSQITPYLFNSSFNDPAYMAYTSGEKPKGVVHAHRVMLGRESIRSSYLNINSNDTVLQIGRPNWTYYMGIGAMDPWCSGATTILYTDEETPEAIYHLIRRYQVTLFSTHCDLYEQLLSATLPSQTELTSLRHVVLSGESASEQAHQFWEKDYKIPFYQAYSTTEFANFISEGPLVEHRHGSFGKIQPNRRVIILPTDPKAPPCDTNQIGLLAAHRHNLGFMLNYFNQPKAEKENFRHDWFLTGDVARIDERGYVWSEKIENTPVPD
jgi:acyl-coenzyme A synthetase/AMP-(fatty) acid ligase